MEIINEPSTSKSPSPFQNHFILFETFDRNLDQSTHSQMQLQLVKNSAKIN
jgi:hypothetical protein